MIRVIEEKTNLKFDEIDHNTLEKTKKKVQKMLENSDLVDFTFKYVQKRVAKAKIISLISKKYPKEEEQKLDVEEEDWSDASDSQ